MDLAQRGHGETIRADLAEESFPILLNIRAPVPLDETQIQPLCRRFTDASWPHAESVDQPGIPAQAATLEPLQAPTGYNLESLGSQPLNIA